MSKTKIGKTNLKKLKSVGKTKISKKRIAFTLCGSLAAIGGAGYLIMACGEAKANDMMNGKGAIIYETETPAPTEEPVITATPIPTVEPTKAPVATATPVPTVEPTATPAPTATPVPTEAPVEEVVITELGVEEFNELVATTEASNKEAGLNLRKENLELAVYINNQNIATPELAQQIESSYNYNEEEMINSYLQTMTAYNNDKLEFLNGEDTKYADVSVMFADEIDRETIKYIDTLFNGVYLYSAYTEDKTEETLATEKALVENVIKEMQGYTMENNTINGYTKDQLTVGGLFTVKLKIDDELTALATTGYASEYEKNINDIAGANVEACVSRTYAILGSKAALVECEEKVKTK